MAFAVAALNDGSELEALLASGVSLDRIAAPLLGGQPGGRPALETAVLGFAEPCGRYQFNLDLEAAARARWTGEIQPGTVVALGDGAALMADGVGFDGHELTRVLLRREASPGQERVFTAERGRIVTSPTGRRVELTLFDGCAYEERGDGRWLVAASPE